MLRRLSHALTRKRLWFFGALAAVMYFTDTSVVAAGVLAGIAGLSLLRILTKRGLTAELLFQDTAKAHGVTRSLKYIEQREIQAVTEYCDKLKAQAYDSSLAQDTLTKAWSIIREAPGQNGGKALRAFRESLPPLADEDHKAEALGQKEDITQRIQEDITQRQRINAELEQL